MGMGVLVEEAHDGLGVGCVVIGHLWRERDPGCGKSNGHFGGWDRGEEGCVRQGLAAEQDELGLGEGGECGGDVEAVTQEQAYRDAGGATVVEGAGDEGGVGVVEDDGGKLMVLLSEMGGESGAKADALGDDGGCGKMAGVEQIG